MLIESTQNPKIKNLLLLQQKQKERRTQNLFVVEGIQENHWALASGFSAKEFFVCEPIFNNQLKLSAKTPITTISKAVFEKLAYRKTTGGILGLYETNSKTLNDLELKENPLILILDSIEKPGNLGAILRGAEAAGVDAIVLSNPLIDLYNPNVIRSSVGTAFLIPVIHSNPTEIKSWLNENKINSYATYLSDSSKSLYQFDYKKPTAFVFGTESTGLTEEWLDFCEKKIIIPMNGKIDSLNVSNACSICLFETMRQRITH